ncbi:MAG: DHH family phosphoesterase [Candidatus Buchananbacteria bacterium]
MGLNTNQQISELIKRSSHILITFSKDFSADALASALAWQHLLQKLDKKVEIVCEAFKVPKNLNFLPTDLIKSELTNLHQFIIALDTNQTKVGEFSYDNQQNKLLIYITPQDGSFKAEDVSTTTSHFKYDLIITLNTDSLTSLGKIYDKNSDFFYHTPVINFDHLANNEHFGQINAVDLTAAATAEVVFNLLVEFDLKMIDEEVATYLLLGLITATKNFKTPNVTPKTLNTASQLIGLGGRREQIIQNLYQSRFLNTLKLWGRVLVRLKSELNEKLAWSVLTQADFVETSTNPEDLADVVDELIVNLPKVEIIALLYEDADHHFQALIYATKKINVLALAKKYNPEGNATLAKFSLPLLDLVAAEKELITEIKTELEKIS